MFIIAAFYPFRVQLVGGLHRLIGQNLYCRVHHPLYYSQNSTKLATAGKLSEFDIDDIKAIDPNLILLAGGTDYGERETAV